ncbi:MAG: phospholipase D-like domain-containing protein [Candidatus Azobacteroides sp.]|nr:phospholipase D-like domain-containing protein [Candidatus Azobacteroides sp.]
MTDKKTIYISNEEHYTLVLEKIKKVQKVLWIGTADIKDVYMKNTDSSVSFLKILSDLLYRGVEIRLMHAKEPGPNFRRDFDKYPILAERLERTLCPRVHFKIFLFDLQTVYIGSANLTGAGIGMKSKDNRNFESGILSSDSLLVENAVNQFDDIWIGKFCTTCKRKQFCGDRIK